MSNFITIDPFDPFDPGARRRFNPVEPEKVTDTVRSKDEKLPPMNCIKCLHRNEYVGTEHLNEKGEYVCRQCK